MIRFEGALGALGETSLPLEDAALDGAGERAGVDGLDSIGNFPSAARLAW